MTKYRVIRNGTHLTGTWRMLKNVMNCFDFDMLEYLKKQMGSFTGYGCRMNGVDWQIDIIRED